MKVKELMTSDPAKVGPDDVIAKAFGESQAGLVAQPERLGDVALALESLLSDGCQLALDERGDRRRAELDLEGRQVVLVVARLDRADPRYDAALRNAIYAATGVALRRMPIDRSLIAAGKKA